MTWFEALFVFVAGMGAGTINAVVGSGTLLTFPALLAVGIPPVLANVSNTIGLAPGTAAGAIGYRRELQGQRGRMIRLISCKDRYRSGTNSRTSLVITMSKTFSGISRLVISTCSIG